MDIKVKMMKPKPELTPEEIDNYMNFDALLTARQRIVDQRKMWYMAGAGAAAVLIGALIYFFVIRQDQPAPTKADSYEQPVVENNAPVATSTDSLEAQVAQEEKEVAAQQTVQKPKEVEVPSITKEAASKNDPKESTYVQAEPVNGYDALFSYFKTNMKYPAEAIGDSIQGVMTVSFVITRDGKPANIEIVKSLGAPFDREAVKLIQNMPAWKPATLNGKPVRSRISLPLEFELKRSAN